MYVLLSRTQAGPGRTFKEEQEEISRNHVQTFISPSVMWKTFFCILDQMWTLRDCYGSLERHHIVGKFNETVTHCEYEDYCNGKANCFPHLGLWQLILVFIVIVTVS